MYLQVSKSPSWPLRKLNVTIPVESPTSVTPLSTFLFLVLKLFYLKTLTKCEARCFSCCSFKNFDMKNISYQIFLANESSENLDRDRATNRTLNPRFGFLVSLGAGKAHDHVAAWNKNAIK